MAIKLRPSAVIKDRATGKLKTEHYYLKSTGTKMIMDIF